MFCSYVFRSGPSSNAYLAGQSSFQIRSVLLRKGYFVTLPLAE